YCHHRAIRHIHPALKYRFTRLPRINVSYPSPLIPFFFFKHTATTAIYTLSLHDALPICFNVDSGSDVETFIRRDWKSTVPCIRRDRKSTRLNSSHLGISYAVFCLKKKKI